MKHWLSPLLVLALLLGASLWTSRSVSRSVEDWCAEIEGTLALAQSEDWDGARRSLDAVYGSWSARQTLFHIVLGHDTLDDAETLFALSRCHAAQEDGAELRADLTQLLTLLTLLREAEALSIRNIL